MDYEDPGWPILGPLIGLLLPFFGNRVARRVGRQDLLSQIRKLFLSLLLTQFLLLLVLTYLDASAGDPSARPGIVAAVVIGAGLLSLATTQAYANRLVRATSEVELVVGYRALFFVRFAFAQLPVVVGFLGFFLAGGRLWVFLIGFGFGLVGFLRLAPTRRSIAREQRALDAAGRRSSLGRLLTTTKRA